MLKHSSSNRARDMVAPQEVREDTAIVCYIYANCVTKLSFLFNVFLFLCSSIFHHCRQLLEGSKYKALCTYSPRQST